MASMMLIAATSLTRASWRDWLTERAMDSAWPVLATFHRRKHSGLAKEQSLVRRTAVDDGECILHECHCMERLFKRDVDALLVELIFGPV